VLDFIFPKRVATLHKPCSFCLVFLIAMLMLTTIAAAAAAAGDDDDDDGAASTLQLM